MALRANGPGATLGRREDGSSAPVYLPVFQARMSVRSTILFSPLTVVTEDPPRLFFVANILTEHARRLLATSSHSWRAGVAGMEGENIHVQHCSSRFTKAVPYCLGTIGHRLLPVSVNS